MDSTENNFLTSEEILVKRRKSVGRDKNVNTIYIQNNRFSRYGHALQSLVPIKIGKSEKLTVESSGLFSFITFSWAIKYLFADNLNFECPRTENCSLNSGRLNTILKDVITLKGKHASVLLVIWKFIKTRTVFATIFYLLSMIFSLSGLVFFLPKVLQSVQNHSENDENKYIYIILLILMQFLSIFFHSWSSAINLRTTVRFRSACFSLLFRQSLFASLTYKISSWQVISFLLPEGNEIDSLIMNLPHLICTPIIIMSCIGFVAHNLDMWGCMSVVIFILFFPILILSAFLIKKFVTRASLYSEKKIMVLEEFIINNLNVKLFQKEKNFERKIRDIRKNEVTNTKKSEFYKKFGYLLIQTQPVLSLSVLCLAYHVEKHSENLETKAQIAAACIILLVHLKYYLDNFWAGLNSFAKGLVSMKRIMKILVLEPIKLYTIKPKGCAIVIEDASFKQNYRNISSGLTLKFKNGVENQILEKDDILKQITMRIVKRNLVGICGLPNSGKTAFFLSIMGLLEKTNGELQVDGHFAYVAQSPFIFNDTLRENILFGEKMDSSKYYHVLLHCNLLQFENKNKIILDSSTLTLDERQRIALARALYADKDIYLLDHFLSATDLNQSLNIFDHCVLDYLKDKTRIIVTHNPEFLAHCHFVIMMKDGFIHVSGSHKELLTDEDYRQLMVQFSEGIHSDFNHESNSQNNLNNFSQSSTSLFDSIDTLGIDSTDQTPLTKSQSVSTISFGSIVGMHLRNCCKITSLFSLFISILNGIFIIALPICFVVTLKEEYKTSVGVLGSYLGTFLIMLVSSLIFNFFFNMKTNSSTSNFQKQILTKLYNASLEFFQEKSLSIISAVSVHLHLGDSEIPLLFHGTMISMFVIITCTLMAGLASLWYLIPAIFVLFFVLIITILVGKALLKFNLLKTDKINVLYRQVVTALAAKPLIQAYRKMDDFIDRLNGDYNSYVVTHYVLTATKYLLSFTIQNIALLFLLSICLIKASMPEEHQILRVFDNNVRSLVGFALIVFCVFQITFHMEKLAMLLIDSILAYDTWSIVKDFQNNIKEETSTEMNGWKYYNESCFAIAFMDVSLSVGQDRKIMEDLNFIVEAKEKMGIIGVSNLEKRAIISALYRLNDSKNGTIMIGKLNLHEVPLYKLRSMISIIPIESHLFDETIMNVLNPEENETQEKIIRALQHFNLYERVRKLQKNLESSVQFLNPDEKQVLLLISAYLKQTPVVIIEGFRYNSQIDHCLRRTLNNLFPITTFLIFANDIRCFDACNRYIIFKNSKILGTKDVIFQQKYSSTQDILNMQNIPETSL